MIKNKKIQFLKLKQGLTFVEVLYSIFILASVLVLLVQISSGSTKNLDRTKRYHLVSQLIDQKLLDFELAFQMEGPSSLQDVEKEVFEKHPGFSWSLKTQSVSIIDIKDFSTDIVEENEWTRIVDNISDQISDLVTEVELTIHYEQKDRQTSYPISTYFIDFKKAKEDSFLQKLLPPEMLPFIGVINPDVRENLSNEEGNSE